MVCALFQLGLGLTEIGFFVFIHLFGLILAQAVAQVGKVGLHAGFFVLVQLLFALGKRFIHLVGQHLGLIVQVQAQHPVRPGRYRHFKGNEYQVLGVARHSETEEEMVVYRALYGEGGLWVRPAAMWLETVTRDGITQPRFTYIGE